MTTPKAAILTEIMLAVFRVNGRLLESGDDLVRDLGLTSARWQVLGAVALADKPLTAPQIAEAMGITRQGAQKQLNRMVKEGIFEQRRNPRHERSPFYALTEKGRRLYAEADALQSGWANRLATGLTRNDLENTLNILNALSDRLTSKGAPP